MYPHIDRNSLFKMSWQFRGIHDPERWDELVRTELEPRLERSLREAQRDGWLELQAVYGYWPALAEGDSVVVFDPEDHEREIERFTFPRQGGAAPALPRRLRPAARAGASGERDVIALQVVTTGPRASEISNRLQAEGDYDDMLRIHGFATQMAEATAEYIHAHIRRELGLGPDQGRRYSWGYPACPDLADHEVLFRIVPPSGSGSPSPRASSWCRSSRPPRSFSTTPRRATSPSTGAGSRRGRAGELRRPRRTRPRPWGQAETTRRALAGSEHADDAVRDDDRRRGRGGEFDDIHGNPGGARGGCSGAHQGRRIPPWN